MKSPDKKLGSESWHASSSESVLELLATSPGGLSIAEASQRLVQYGPNRLAEAKTRGPLLRFLSQFHNVLIYVLIAAGAVTAMLQHWVDAGVIFGVVLINAMIGYVQEGADCGARDELSATEDRGVKCEQRREN